MSIPGYADLQINGYQRVDFSDPEMTADQFLVTAERIFQTGTWLFLPTITTSAEAVYRRNIKLIHDAVVSHGLEKQIPGVHVEGPFISRQSGAVGAHPPKYVLDAEIPALERMLDWGEGFIKLLTVAAELPGITEFIRFAVSQGIRVSCGHQLAGYEDLQKAAQAGAVMLTHLGNGMPNLIDRHHNTIFAGLACDDLTAAIITDGHHLPPELIKVIVKAKGADRIVVTSDTTLVAGLPPGRYQMLGNDGILEPNGKFHNPEKHCLIGASCSLKQCIDYLATLDLLTPEELDQVGYWNPMKLIGML